MNIIETIKDEVERLMNKANNGDGSEYFNGAKHTLISLLDFLDTLEGNSEKPNNHEGLDEAAEGIYKTPFYTRADDFKAGAEWRDRQLNWARDLVQAGIDKPKEAVSILKRLKELI